MTRNNSASAIQEDSLEYVYLYTSSCISAMFRKIIKLMSLLVQLA